MLRGENGKLPVRRDGGGSRLAVIAPPEDAGPVLLETEAVDLSVEPCAPLVTKAILHDPPSSLVAGGTEKEGEAACLANEAPIVAIVDRKHAERRIDLDRRSRHRLTHDGPGYAYRLRKGHIRYEKAADDDE